jgi:hypothetical protein
MCACGCFLLVAVAAGLAYCVMHGLWLIAVAVLLLAALIAWLSKKTLSKKAWARSGNDSRR